MLGYFQGAHWEYKTILSEDKLYAHLVTILSCQGKHWDYETIYCQGTLGICDYILQGHTGNI